MMARGHWPRGRRRKGIEGCGPILSRIGSLAAIARAAGVSPRAVGKWRTGRSAPSEAQLWAVIDALIPPLGGRESGFACVSGGVSETTLTAGTPFGVGQYTLRAAAGLPCTEAVEDDAEPPPGLITPACDCPVSH